MESVNSVANSPDASSPAKSPSHPLLGLGRHNHDGFWSSDAREEAIARGRWELMEMVKNMPESSYELSLKDLVENQETNDRGPNRDSPRAAAKPKTGSREETKRIDYRDRNKGMFLNIVVLPSSMKAKNKTKNRSGKVSPNRVDRGEKDCGRKRFSDHGGGSSSSGERKINVPPTGCWPSLCFRRSKTL